MPQYLLRKTKLHLKSSWPWEGHWDLQVNFLYLETWGREDPAQVLRLKKTLQETMQKGSQDRDEEKGSGGPADVRHHITWNGTLKLHIWSWIFTVGKGNSGGGRRGVSDSGSQVTGEARKSSTEGPAQVSSVGIDMDVRAPGGHSDPEGFVRGQSTLSSRQGFLHISLRFFYCKELEHEQISWGNHLLVSVEVGLKKSIVF